MLACVCVGGCSTTCVTPTSRILELRERHNCVAPCGSCSLRAAALAISGGVCRSRYLDLVMFFFAGRLVFKFFLASPCAVTAARPFRGALIDILPFEILRAWCGITLELSARYRRPVHMHSCTCSPFMAASNSDRSRCSAAAVLQSQSS